MGLWREGFSALQRAEIAEIGRRRLVRIARGRSFSALQRAEIAEIAVAPPAGRICDLRFSALQRAEIAEMFRKKLFSKNTIMFQCSSTSRNC